MNGFDNEYSFVVAINRKKVKELNPLLRELIDNIFYGIDENDEITCWRNHQKQKVDIIIRINKIIKTISIKIGSKNSVHVESISEFVNFLKENNFNDKEIEFFYNYHYGEGDICKNGIEKYNIEELKERYKKEIISFNKKISTNICFLDKVVDRFILKGNNSKYCIDALFYGSPNDFIWIGAEEIRLLIINKRHIKSSTINFGPLIYQPLNRCLNNNLKYIYGREFIQIKWYSLFDDIIENMNKRKLKKKLHYQLICINNK